MEKSLIERVIRGEEEAARELYEAHAERIHRLVIGLTAHEDMARECTQLAFVRAFAKLHTFRGEAAFSTWLHRIAMNVTLTYMRRVRRERAVVSGLEGLAEIPASSVAGDPMLRDRLKVALAALPDGFRIVVVMHDIEGRTHEEIGQALEIAVGTSKARLSRARARLRTLLAGCALEYAA
jgi:RNA polymerase sigma-70 factor, ECF subfamily